MSLTRETKLISPLFSMAAEYGIPAATLTAVLIASVLCAYGSYTRAASIVAVAVAAGALLSSRVSLYGLALFWFAATPVASYYLRFPAEKSVITFDRAVFAIAFLLLVSEWRKRGITVSKFEISWALLSVLAISSAMIESNNIGYAIRIAVDSFWLPLIAFHLARYHLDIRGRARAFVLVTIALSILLFVAGVYELRTGTDLFQYPGSQILREGEPRVNGPFISDSSYAIISLMLGIFLWLAPAIFRVRLDGSGSLVHLLAVGAAIVGALLPLFRAVAFAMIICWGIVLRYAKRRDRSGVPAQKTTRRLAVVVVLLFLTLGAFALFAMTAGGQRLLDPYNLIGRIPTWVSATRIAIENPLTGVGLANYRDHFHEKYFTGVEMQESVLLVRAADTPHSNPLWVASELGAVAFVLYLAANVYIFRMGYRAFRRADATAPRAAAICYMALVISYWIPGLTLSSGVYSDLNLYFFFLLGLLANRFSAAGERPEYHQSHDR